MDEEIREKIIKYEHFLNETLKSDLKKALDAREYVFAETSQYLQLRNVIEGVMDSKLDKEPLKTKIDLGCNFYVQAKVDDPSRICICIGYGFFLEMTLTEALKFIDKKTKHLNMKSELHTKDINTIKANVKMVLEGLRELHNIEDKPEKLYRDILS